MKPIAVEEKRTAAQNAAGVGAAASRRASDVARRRAVDLRLSVGDLRRQLAKATADRVVADLEGRTEDGANLDARILKIESDLAEVDAVVRRLDLAAAELTRRGAAA